MRDDLEVEFQRIFRHETVFIAEFLAHFKLEIEGATPSGAVLSDEWLHVAEMVKPSPFLGTGESHCLRCLEG